MRPGRCPVAKTIMTVDDSASVRQMVSFTLKTAGYDVLEAADGEQALARLQGQVHLILTDLNMPRMDGIELVKRVRADATYKYVPIVLLTTESQDAKKQAGKTAGATGWIVKPFQPEKLLAVIKKVLG
jgi:two-component system chemotaxis response regulator CheY